MHELELLERELRVFVEHLALDQLLIQVHSCVQEERLPGALSGVKPFPHFVAATVVDFAMRFGTPGGQPVSEQGLELVFRAAHDYAIFDPVGHDENVTAEFHAQASVPMIIRLLGKQWRYHSMTVGAYARCELLWREAVRVSAHHHPPDFDFERVFQSVFDVSLDDYFAVALHAADFAHQEGTFTRAAFAQRRVLGYTIPGERAVSRVVDALTADGRVYREEYDRWTPEDQRFRSYTPSPICALPMLRPWSLGELGNSADHDRLIAPFWWLVTRRISDTIYYRLRETPNFLASFGHIYSAYVGALLRATYGEENVWDLDDFWPKEEHADWFVRDGDDLLVFECKATIFGRTTLHHVTDAPFRRLVGKIAKGLSQCDSATEAVRAARTFLPEMVRGHTGRVHRLVVTYEYFPGMNGPGGRDYIAPGERDDWTFLGLEELEAIQPHLERGESLVEICSRGRSVRVTAQALDAEAPDALKQSFIGRQGQHVMRRYLRHKTDSS